MNRRQKKKAFKKRFGFNAPKSIGIKLATQAMEYEKKITQKEIYTAFIELAASRRRRWESEAKQIESNSDIHNHDRR